MSPTPKKSEKSEFLDALRKGALLGVAILVVVIPPMRYLQNRDAAPPAGVAQAHTQPPAGRTAPRAPAPIRLADFRDAEPSDEARQLANWAVYTKDHQKHAFVLIDKKDARVYVFGPDGKLADSTPALLGSAQGDDSAPGVGDKPLAELKPEEKTTPAGRYVAERGLNTHGEDIVWIDYDAAVSMHRIRPLPGERRLERLASPTIDDNRISNGCVNLPVTFYEGVLSPTVQKYGAIVYVLPETRDAHQVFGSFDPRNPVQQVAFERQPAAR